MLIEKINLWDDDENVALHTYILTNSKEYQKDQKRPAVLICPGGGYLGTSDREAEPIAMRFAALGYHTFVLRYTTYFNTMNLDFQNLPAPNEKSAYPQPLADLAKAMLIVRENAANWLIDTDRIAVCGFSAGGHLAASLGVHWHSGMLRDKLKVENEWFKPNAVILGYPLLDYQLMKEKVEEDPNEFAKGFWEISNKALLGTPHPSEDQLQEVSPGNHISDKTPATFIWHTADDGLVYAENALNYAAALARNKVPYELHVFENGVHGLSLSDEVTAGNDSHINEECQVWFELASKWLKKRFK